MSILWKNNATSALASDITAGSLSITVTTGHGDRFPEVVAPHYCMVTLVDTSGNREIVKVTARESASNTMTIERAQEGTTARAFEAGSVVELRITKNAMDEVSKASDINAQHYVCDASAADQGATANSNSLKSIVDALGATEEATIELPHTGTGDTTTYTVGTDLTIPDTVRLIPHKGVRISPSAGVTLTANCIIEANYQIFAGDGTVTVNSYPQDQAWWGSAQRLDGNINGFSANNTSLRATHDPYPDASENLPVSLLEEIQSIRYLLQQITGKTYWYQDPDTTLAGLVSALAATPKMVSALRYADDDSGDVEYSGFGITPKQVIIIAGNGGAYGQSIGTDDGTTHYCNYTRGNDAETHSHQCTNNYSIYNRDAAGTSGQHAIVKSFAADKVTITWTKVGTPTHDLSYIKIIAF
jgi:hypothetical protein